MTFFTSPLPLIRPALPLDKDDVAEFTKFIWDGHDYVGGVFPRWLEDPQGILLAAEYAGRCVGCAKVTLISPGQWWLEGFRVDPNFQGRKIGSMLDAAANEWWDAHGGGAVRLLTNAKRVQVHHLSEARGFVKLGEVLAYSAEPLREPADAFTPLAPHEVDEAAAFCRTAAPGRLMSLGWKFAEPDAGILRVAAAEGLAWWWRGRSGFLSAWTDEADEGIRLVIGLDVCAMADRTELLTDARRLASARGANAAGWMGIVNEAVIQCLDAAGYKRAWEDSGYLYERRHP